MSALLKALVVVLVIALAVFQLARPVALRFMSASDFARRRNVWLAITVAAFVCPDFIWFCAVSACILVPAARREPNPGALFLMLIYVVPDFSWRVPMVGVSYLVDLDFEMLLSLCVMLPVAVRLLRGAPRPAARRLEVLDLLLLAYLGLRSVFFILPEIGRGVLMEPTATDNVRRLIESLLSLFVPYYVLSRSSASRRQVQELLATFCLAAAVIAAMGIFEGAKHWLLYNEMRSNWGDYQSYLLRGEELRARASTSHPLALGYVCAVAFGFWLCLKERIASTAARVTGIALYWFGLLAAYSRGPWVGAGFIYFSYVALSRQRLSAVIKAAAGAALVVLLLAMTPLGAKIQNVIPYFGGTVDAWNITYRERLADRAWQIVADSPWLGDQRALAKMEDLRQGEGIIDLVNGYVDILLDNGFLGLSLFLSFVLLGAYRAWTSTRQSTRYGGAELSNLSASILACILGTLLMMLSNGRGDAMIYVLTGIAAAIAAVARREAAGGDGLNTPGGEHGLKSDQESVASIGALSDRPIHAKRHPQARHDSGT
jgi:hypothetical protein